MRATKEYVEKKYAEFNHLCFSDQLPPLPVELSDAKTFLGMLVCKRRRRAGAPTVSYDYRLRINTRVDLPEPVVEDTIIHEMIHYYIAVNRLRDTSAHGQVFRRIMNGINTRYSRHITVSHKMDAMQKEQAYGSRRRWHVVALVAFRDGRTGIKVLPRIVQRIVNYYYKVGMSPMVDHIELYMSDDPWLNRFPNSSALNASFVELDEAKRHLSVAERLTVKGTNILRERIERNSVI